LPGLSFLRQQAENDGTVCCTAKVRHFSYFCMALKQDAHLRNISILFMIGINIQEYNYDLPDKRIAQHPISKRDSSRLLLYKDNQISEDVFRNISSYVPNDSLLVFNNTRVIRARLILKRKWSTN